MAASPSNLPTPTPTISLPPKLKGKVTHLLHFTISKVVWTSSPVSENLTTTPASPRVRLVWWGEDGPGTTFHPFCVGSRSLVERATVPSTPSSSSSLPVPLLRAKTWTGHSPPSSSKLVTVLYPVRCHKTQLASYFRDMQLLVLQVIADGRLIGEACVPDLVALTQEPSKPINGFFPIVERQKIRPGLVIKSDKRRKLGELYVSIMLEPVGASTEISDARPALVRHQTMSSGIRPSVDPAILQYPSPEADKPRAMTGKVQSRSSSPGGTGDVSIESASLAMQAGQLRATIQGLPADLDDEGDIAVVHTDVTKAEGPLARPQPRPRDGESSGIFHKSPTVTTNDAVPSGSTLQGKRGHADITETTHSARPTLSLSDDDDDVDARIESAIKSIGDLSLDLDERLIPGASDSSDSSNSELLEDDILIEALNSAAGKYFIDSRTRRSRRAQYDKENMGAESSGSDQEKDEDEADLSPDERKRRALFVRPSRNKQIRPDVTSSPPARQKLSVDRLTSLGRVNVVKITIRSLELLAEANPHPASNYNVRVTLPHGTSNAFTESSSIPSKSRPRLTAARSANQRSDPPPPPMYITTFDHEQIFPCTFDSDLVELWLKEKISFAIRQEHGPQTRNRVAFSERVKDAQRTSVWAVDGLLACSDIVLSQSLTWNGRIPLYQSKARPIASNKMRAGPSKLQNGQGTLHGKCVGHLVVDVSLKDERAQPIASEASPLPLWNPVNPHPAVKHDTLQQRAETFQGPCYFHLTISTARALAVLPSLDTTGMLLYLVIRFFSSTTPPVESPPVAFKSPFDLKTGRLNASPNFNFSYTVPLAITKEFLDTHGETPLIAEIWVVDSESADRTVKTGTQGHLLDRGAKLLGLLRLPFPHLLHTFATGWTETSGLRDGFPVMIPGAEYAIMDPFSGSAKGWVMAFMALGTWDQVNKVRKQGTESEPSPTLVVEETPAEPNPRNKKLPSKDVEHREISSRKTQKITKSSKKSVACEINVAFHRACGLRALVNGLLSRSRRKSYHAKNEFTPMDYARETGTNAYIRFRLTNDRLPDDSDRSEDSVDQEDDEIDIIETPIAAQTFVPAWNHNMKLILPAKGLLRWMRHGGEARGEIWHRVPQEIADGEEGEDVLLGTFNVPLQSVATRKQGLQNHWITVVGEDDAEAAVCLSLRIKNSYHLGIDANEALSTTGDAWWSRVVIQIGKVLVVNSNYDAADDGEMSGATALYVRYSVPQTPSDGLDSLTDAEWTTVSSNPVLSGTGRSGSMLSVDMAHENRLDLQMSPRVMKSFSTRGLSFEVLSTAQKTPLATASIDPTELIRKACTAQRKRGKAKRDGFEYEPDDETFVIDRFCPLIEQESPDLQGAKLHVRVQILPISKPSGATKPAATTLRDPVLSEAQSRTSPTFVSKTAPSKEIPQISIDITVEKAIQLPLVTDPLAEYLPSPFLPRDAPQLAPPNAFVTFEWDQTPSTASELRTPVIPAQSCPAWQHAITVYQEKTEAGLKSLKSGKHVLFKVWHLAEATRSSGLRSQDSAGPELIGVATVDLAGLFGGLKEIYGWYPVLDSRNSPKGQLLVRVLPQENVAAVLREMTGKPSYESIGRGSRGRRPLKDLCATSPSTVHVPAVAIAMPKPERQADAGPANNFMKSSLFAAAASTASQTSNAQSVDTWVWTGVTWEHRHVDVQRAGDFTNSEAVVRPSQRHSEPSTVVGVPNSSEEGHPASFRCTVRQDANEQDSLKTSFRRDMEKLEVMNKELRQRADLMELPPTPLNMHVDPAHRSGSPTPPPRHFKLSRRRSSAKYFSPPTDSPCEVHHALQTPPKTDSPALHKLPNTASPIPERATNVQAHSSSPTPVSGQSPSSKFWKDDVFENSDGSPSAVEAGELRISHLGAMDPRIGELLTNPSPARSPLSQPERHVKDMDDTASESRHHRATLPGLAAEGPSEQPTQPRDSTLPSSAKSAQRAPSPLSHMPTSDILLRLNSAQQSTDHNHVITSNEADRTWSTLTSRLDALHAEVNQSQNHYPDDFESEDDEDASHRSQNSDDGQLASDVEETSTISPIPPLRVESDDGSDDDQDDPARVRLAPAPSRTERTAYEPESTSSEEDDPPPPRRQSSPPSIRLAKPSAIKSTLTFGTTENDSTTSDDDEMYSLPAYKRMVETAAAAANSPPNKPKPREPSFRQLGSRPTSLPPRIPAADRMVAQAAYDPFGVRPAGGARVGWKVARDSSDTDDPGGEADARRRRRRRADESSRVVGPESGGPSGDRTGDWRSQLSARTAALDRDRQERMKQIFGRPVDSVDSITSP
ncbi:C2 domain-containing protein 3 [Thoreauomyces humboldtii]|nr:C2 domain-containing protein 3 [Thoreauomyces humboldtii]